MLEIVRIAKYIPSLPYEEMAKSVLPKDYALTLAFIGEQRALRLNKWHRKGNYVPNVLSFPLTKGVGEIYITSQVAKREARRFDMTVKGYVGYLFIHGLLHLKGHDHGDTMDTAEQKYIRQFNLR